MTFRKGESGNPQGARLHKPKPVQEFARNHTEDAISALAALMLSNDQRIVLDAAEALLSRGWGKPAQAVEHGGDADNPMQHEHRVVITPQ